MGDFEINITLDRSFIEKDSVQTLIQLSSSMGDIFEIPVLIHQFPENKLRYRKNVVDIALDTSGQLLFILINGYPGQIDIYDLTHKTTSVFPLNNNVHLYLTNLFLMPSGDFLIINTGEEILQFDIDSKEIIFSTKPEDYIGALCGNSERKLFVNTFAWEQNFYSINLETQEFTTSSIGYMDSKSMLEMHPSEKYIFSDSDLSGLIKTDISVYPFETISYFGFKASRLWLTGNGNEIITSMKDHILVDPESPGHEVLSAEVIEAGDPYIYDVAYSQENDRYFIIFTTTYNYPVSEVIKVFNGEMEHLYDIIPEPFMYLSENNSYGFKEAKPLKTLLNPIDHTLIALTKASLSGRDNYGVEIIPNN